MYKDLTPHERVTAVGIDLTRNALFAQLSGVAMVGKVEITDRLPTAATNGRDEYYNPDFVLAQNRKQLRYVRIHENLHKLLKHCVEYKDVCKRYPKLSNIAMDHVINLTIEEIDPNFTWVERPTVEPCVDAKYKGWGFLRVLRDLIDKGGKEGGGGDEGGGERGGGEGGFDDHLFDELDEGEAEEAHRQIDEAARQGKILADKLAGDGKGGSKLDLNATKRNTEWRQHFREFFDTICKGDEHSRFVPPNKRFAPLGILLPSHFSYNKGEIIIAGDTSGSMGPIYPILFGEIAQIAQTVMPDALRVIWWDTSVCGEQLFKPDDYHSIATLMKPMGGGGTSPQCVVKYIAEKQYKPRAVIWLTDGYLSGDNAVVPCAALWGIVDNEHFIPPQGKAVHIKGRI
jgi:predicted metal-dependent peptidase